MSLNFGSEIAMGFEPPMNTQFSVFLDNRVGKLAALLDVFHGHALELAALSVVDSTGHAVVRALTSRAVLARRLLERHGMPFAEADVLVVEISDSTSVSEICQTLLAAEIAVNYAYPTMCLPGGRSAIVMQTDDNVLAGQILRRKLFTLLGENDLGDNATPGTADDIGMM